MRTDVMTNVLAHNLMPRQRHVRRHTVVEYDEIKPQTRRKPGTDTTSNLTTHPVKPSTSAMTEPLYAVGVVPTRGVSRSRAYLRVSGR